MSSEEEPEGNFVSLESVGAVLWSIPDTASKSEGYVDGMEGQPRNEAVSKTLGEQ